MYKIFIFSFLTFFSSCLEARFETIAEAESKMEFINRDIYVKADGTSEEIFEEQIQVLNETGRRVYESARFYYNENSEKLEVLEAKSISAADGKVYHVPLEMIENKPLASVGGGFDETRQITVAFPNLRLNDRIYYKVRRTVTNVLLPGYYDTGFYYGEYQPIMGSKISIKSDLKLFTDIYNADKVLRFSEAKKAGKYNYTIELTKPIYRRANERGVIPKKKLTRIFFSSLNDNATLAARLSAKYEKVLAQPLPTLYTEIAAKAEKKKTDVDKINAVISTLADKINYRGDWRTVEGQMVPRDFKKVAETGIGDCKDFSSAVVVILRKIGFQASSALVKRGYIYLEPHTDLPYMSSYNHAILRAHNKQGRVFWLDPTNMTAMADGIYPDIEGRPSLVLDKEKPRLDFIPHIQAKHSVVEHSKVIEKYKETGIKESGSYKMSGEIAADRAGSGLRRSELEIKESFISFVSGENTVLDKQVALPDLKTRIVKPLVFKYSYKKENMLRPTTMGLAFPLMGAWANMFLYAPEDQVSARDLGSQQTLISTTTLKEINVSDLSKLNKDIASPWLDATRSAEIIGKDVMIKDKVIFKKNFIFGKEVKSEAFKKLRADLKNYFAEIYIVDEKK